MAQVFISHSSRDNALAEDMKRWLAEQGFDRAFLDIDKHSGIPPGANWERELYEKIAASQAMIVISTPSWHDSKWCFVEFAQARALGKPIFPVVFPPGGERLIAPDIQQLDLTPDHQGGLDRLAQQLWTLAVNAQGGFDWDRSRPPYPGMAAFEQEDAAVFFGRDDDVRACIEQLNARRVQGAIRAVVLLGASGSGKSSVIRAGVLPRIAKDRRNWIVTPPFRPGHDPVAAFARAMAAALDELGEWRAWRDRLTTAAGFEELADRLRAHAVSREAQILVTVDQGEEVFTFATAETTPQFFDLLARMTTGALPFIILFCIRSDYLDRLQQAAGDLRFSPLPLGPFPLQRVREVIEGPARIAGLRVTEEFVSKAIGDMNVHDALPLLAFTLRELYDRVTAPGSTSPMLTLAEYQALGNPARGLSPLENAVQRRAEEAVSALALQPEDLQALREAFVGHMVRINDEGLYDRCPANWQALPERARPILEALARVRLVVIRQADHGTVVEAAHEALLRTWPLLRGWLDAESDFLVGRKRLLSAFDEWQRAGAGEKQQALLRGLLLSRARTWLVDHAYALASDEKAFIEASIRASEVEARAARRRRGVAWALAGVAGLCVVAAGFLLHAQAQARARAESAALIVQARESLADGRARDALLEASDAVGHENSVEARSALLEALLATPPFLGPSVTVKGLRPNALAWSPRSDALALGGAGKVVVWHPEAGGAVTDIDLAPSQTVDSMRVPVRSLAWDQRGLAAALENGTLVLGLGEPNSRQVRTLTTSDQLKQVALGRDGLAVAGMFQEPKVLAFHCQRERDCQSMEIADSYATALAIAPDGREVAIGDADGTLRLARTEGGESATPSLGNGKNAIRALAYSADGERLAAGMANGDLVILTKRGAPIATANDGPGSVSSVAWDGKIGRVAAVCGHGMICVWALDDGGQERPALRRVVRLAVGAEDVAALAWSPDGRFLASCAGDEVQLRTIDRHDGALSTLDAGTDAALSVLGVSQDGNWLAAGDAKGDTHLWRLPEFATATHWHPEGAGEFKALAWSQDGKIALVDDNGRLIAFRPPARSISADVSLGADDVQALQWMPEGDAVIDGGPLDGSLPLTSLDGQDEKPFPRLHHEAVTALAVSPDGKRLLSADASGVARLWHIAARTAGPEIATGAGRGTALFSNDGALALVAGNDGDVLVYRVADLSAPPRRCHSGSTMLDDATFSADGTAVYALGGDRTARLYIWTLQSGCDLLATAPVPTGAAGKERRHLAVLPGSGRLAVIASTSQVWLVSPDPAAWRSVHLSRAAP